MENDKHMYKFYKQLIHGFVAGFCATVTYHQVVLWLLWKASIAPFSPFNMAATQPWGIPVVFSLALWGGVWGALFASLYGRLRHSKGYWIKAFGFGAVFPSLVALLIVAPLKGHPLGGGWHWPLLVTVFLINGAWGIGTGVLLELFLKMSRQRHLSAPECIPGMLCKE